VGHGSLPALPAAVKHELVKAEEVHV